MPFVRPVLVLLTGIVSFGLAACGEATSESTDSSQRVAQEPAAPTSVSTRADDTVFSPGTAMVESATTNERVANSDEWQDAADTFEDQKTELEAELTDEGLATPGDVFVNSPDANYLSEPIDITSPGEYTMVFNDIDPAHVDLGFTTLFPDDLTFRLQPGLMRMPEELGANRIEFDLIVEEEGFLEPYLGFSIWLV